MIEHLEFFNTERQSTLAKLFMRQVNDWPKCTGYISKEQPFCDSPASCYYEFGSPIYLCPYHRGKTAVIQLPINHFNMCIEWLDKFGKQFGIVREDRPKRYSLFRLEHNNGT